MQLEKASMILKGRRIRREGIVLLKGNSKRIEVIRKRQIIGKVVHYINGELHK